MNEDCEIQASKILSFLPAQNNPVTIGLNFLLDSISVVLSSNTLNTLPFFVGL